jgi:hypothetical protein
MRQIHNKILDGKPEGNKPLGRRSKNRWQDIFKRILKAYYVRGRVDSCGRGQGSVAGSGKVQWWAEYRIQSRVQTGISGRLLE